MKKVSKAVALAILVALVAGATVSAYAANTSNTVNQQPAQ
jgi:hypothetical protein